MTRKRWYDFDQKLSTVVHTMEFMNLASQQRFAEKLLELSEELLRERGGGSYLETLQADKKAGLQKSQAKKRWYDQYETLHQAFNNLYALPNVDRREVAARLVTPIQIVEGYEQHCKKQDKEPDEKIIEEILRTSFQDGQERARRLYSLYLDEFTQQLEASQRELAERMKGEPKGLWSILLKSIQRALSPA